MRTFTFSFIQTEEFLRFRVNQTNYQFRAKYVNKIKLYREKLRNVTYIPYHY